MQVIVEISHPLREDVSWNILFMSDQIYSIVILFVRMWVEIISIATCCQPYGVILFVRMWVEISRALECLLDSSVILFVRMWVEISSGGQGYATITVILFVRMWVEIKSNVMRTRTCKSHPLREDVSWNHSNINITLWLSTSSSSWGCELKFNAFIIYAFKPGHPLREDVSWNT